MSFEQRQTLKEFTHQYRKMIQIGKVVSVIDPEHPKYFEELFLVIGFQPNIYGYEDYVAIMDNHGRVFLAKLDCIILKDMFTVDDVFPAKETDIFWINKES